MAHLAGSFVHSPGMGPHRGPQLVRNRPHPGEPQRENLGLVSSAVSSGHTPQVHPVPKFTQFPKVTYAGTHSCVSAPGIALSKRPSFIPPFIHSFICASGRKQLSDTWCLACGGSLASASDTYPWLSQEQSTAVETHSKRDEEPAGPPSQGAARASRQHGAG